MSNKPYFSTIIVVLVYKNIAVLKDFFRSLSMDSCKVIVVNSFYDEKSLKECEDVARINDAIFLPIPNKGYGYGNNVGVKYALDNYSFDFLVLSNSDIEIKKIELLKKFKCEDIIIAPKTIMRTGKHQNPDTPWELPFIYPMLSYALNKKSKLVYVLCHICTRLSREVFRLYAFIIRKERYRIFSAHGSFVIFTKKSAAKMYPFFDEEMFLFNEEWYLALKARKMNVPTYFIPQIEVFHYEGASSNNIVYSEQDKLSFNTLNYKRKNNLI